MPHVIYKNIIPFDWQGLQIRELTPTDIEFASIAEIEVPAGNKHPIARSTKSNKLYICIEGTFVFHLEKRELILEPKDILVIRKNEWFDYQNRGSRTGRLFLIHFPPFDLEREEFFEQGDV